jgi:hypothetical protein
MRPAAFGTQVALALAPLSASGGTEASMCVTIPAETLASEARELTREIEAGLLAFASAEARDEWASFRRRWSPEALSRVETSYPDEPFESVVDRMRRFRTILKARSQVEASAAA